VIDRSSREVTSRLNAMLYACHQQSVNSCRSQLPKRIEGKYVIATAEKSLRGYPVIISCDSRYLNGAGFIELSGFNRLSIR